MSVVEEKAIGQNTNFVSTVDILIQRFYLGNPWQCPIAIKNASIYLEPKRRIGLFQKNSLEVKGKNISQSLLGTLAWAIPPLATRSLGARVSLCLWVGLCFGCSTLRWRSLLRLWQDRPGKGSKLPWIEGRPVLPLTTKESSEQQLKESHPGLILPSRDRAATALGNMCLVFLP